MTRGRREKLAFPGLVVTGSFELQVWVLWSLKEQYELIGPEPPPAPVYCKAGFRDCGFVVQQRYCYFHFGTGLVSPQD